MRGWELGRIAAKADTAFLIEHDIDKTMTLYRIVLSRVTDTVTQREKMAHVIATVNLGHFWLFERNNPEQAYALLRQALELISRHDSLEMFASEVHTNLAKIYLNYQDRPNALLHYRLAFESAMKQGNPFYISFDFIDLSHFAWLNGMLEVISKECDEFDKWTPSTEPVPGMQREPMTAYGGMMNKARHAWLAGDFGHAAALVAQARGKIAHDPEENRYAAVNNLIEAKAWLDAKEPGRAGQALESARAVIWRDSIADLRDQYYNLRKAYYLASGNKDMAWQCDYLALKTRDSLFNSQRYGIIRDMESAWDASAYDSKIKKANEEKEHEVRRRQQQRNTTVAIGLVALVIAASLAWAVRKNRQLNQSNRELFLKNLELLNASESMAAAGKHEPQDKDKDKEPNADDELISQQIFSELEAFMNKSPKIYDPDFTIDSLCQATGFKFKQVSQAINSQAHANFNAYLSVYRVRRACRLLLAETDSKTRPTIEYVAQEVGYRSRSHFSKVFKAVTGLTSTEFLKQSRSNS